jgi:quinol monooxygenase YgiN
MILIAAEFVIQPDQRDRFAEVLSRFAAATREYQGVNRCLACEISGSQAEWLIFTEYTDGEATRAHETSGELLQFMEAIGSLLADTPKIQMYEVSTIQTLM